MFLWRFGVEDEHVIQTQRNVWELAKYIHFNAPDLDLGLQLLIDCGEEAILDAVLVGLNPRKQATEEDDRNGQDPKCDAEDSTAHGLKSSLRIQLLSRLGSGTDRGSGSS